MATATTKKPTRNDPPPRRGPVARSVQLASRGLDTTQDFTRFGSALVSDIMTDAVDTKKANAAIRSSCSLLRFAEFQYRHGAGKPVSLTNLNGAVVADDPPETPDPRDDLREKFEEFLQTL